RIDRLEDSLALAYCLKTAGIGVPDLSLVVGCHFSGARIAGCGIHHQGWSGQHLTIPHHLGHAVGAFAQSGFSESAILVIDGAGGMIEHLPAAERTHLVRSRYPTSDEAAEIATIYAARNREIVCIEKHSGMWISKEDRASGSGMPRFGSLGGMYASAAQQIFGDANDAGKVMGLAASGQANIPESDFFQILENGTLSFSDAVCERFGDNERWPSNREALCDLAASVQSALETGVNHLASRLKLLTQAKHLTYCGGVALNCVANEVLIGRGIFDDIYIAPAAEDSGPAVGAAYYGLWQLGLHHQRARFNHDSLGGRYATDATSAAVDATPGIRIEAVPDKHESIVDALINGEIVGWFSGGSELGPRALGHRSILADARSAEAKTRLNDRVKHRESFRPFAPLVLADQAHRWFELPPHLPESPLMLRSFPFKPEMAERVPSAVHNDGTGRLQTLTDSANPDLYRLLQRYFKRTGVPILINTSFNVMGEPIVETPGDALWCLAFTDIDRLMLEDRVVIKSATHSFLTLVPQFQSVTWNVRSRALNDFRSSDIRLDTKTPWGTLKIPVSRPLLPLLSVIEKGELTVQQLVGLLERQYGLEPKTTLTAIYLLRRKRVIELTAPLADS
ncbi:MAG: carbamoyltransferase C-terminal domain-containing protein, partial [Pseudomonadota bacterium]